MKILGIIPSRYGSTRFPGKLLVDIAGKSMVRRVYEQASKAKSLTKVIVATDHEAIVKEVNSFCGHVRMTSSEHQSGTDRCNEVLLSEVEQFDYVINIQGDEPFIEPSQIDDLASCLDHKTQLATLIKKINHQADLLNPNIVKVIINKEHEALYFSRQTIPYLRGKSEDIWLTEHCFFKHIGIYAYKREVLAAITKLPVSSLENAESLEQLRWLENGYKIKVTETSVENYGIDTPEDLERVLSLMKKIK